ncbi:MAG: hypothetical protein J1E34_02145 [Oscillospiraceae bacterium]|nr:hypothetical protein [Oscillospiraceae bacterium]
MKKVITLILVFVLTFTALSGCKQLSETDPEVSQSGLFFQLESLPDIGEFVSQKKAEYFFEDGAQNTFEPRGDYGSVLPYFAGIDFYSEVIDEDIASSWTDYEPLTDYRCSYGLMNGEGKIITGSLWSVYQYYGFDKNSGIFYLLRPTNDNGGKTDIISADGSWKIEAKSVNGLYVLFEFGLPMFVLGDGDKSKIYSLDGSEVLDVSQYMRSEKVYVYSEEDDGEENKTEVFYYCPEIVYADDELFLIKVPSEGREDDDGLIVYDSGEYVALSHSGEKLYSFTLENTGLRYLGNGMLVCEDYITNECVLMNPKGERLSESSYDSVFYSDADKAVLGVKEGAGELFLSWFNERAELTDKIILNEKDEAYYLFKDNYPVEAPNGSVFFDDASFLSYKFFAEPVEFPVPKSEIRRIMTVYSLDYNYEGVDDIECYYFGVFTKDGRCLLCTLNGELICETEQPKNFNAPPGSDSYYGVDLFIRGNYVCCVTENRKLYVYSFNGEKCAEADISGLVDGYDRFYISNFNDSIAVLGFYSDTKNNLCVISLEDGSVLYNDLISWTRFGEVYLVAEKTFTAVLNSSGKEIIRLPLGGLA